MKEFISKYKHAWCLLYAFIYLPWFVFLEKNVLHYSIIHIRLDDYIPFNEYFIIPYFLWFAYVAVAIMFFFFTNKEDYYKLCAFLFIGMTISLIICTIWPNGHNLRPTEFARENIFTDMVRGLWATDTPTNIFPSIHVYNSIGVHLAVMNSEALKKKRVVRIISFALMASICLSTVFLKQHSALDGIGAIVMSMFMYRMVYHTERVANREKLEGQFN
ncbi:MAG: phosphoesterase [Lachnospiraceae bacterium]|nr:phosphoesterase [Lachnospiraceae bacterium]